MADRKALDPAVRSALEAFEKVMSASKGDPEALASQLTEAANELSRVADTLEKWDTLKTQLDKLDFSKLRDPTKVEDSRSEISKRIDTSVRTVQSRGATRDSTMTIDVKELDAISADVADLSATFEKLLKEQTEADSSGKAAAQTAD